MGQAEVYNYLKKHRGWVSSTEIQSALKCSKSPLNTQLRKLLKHGEVERKAGKVRQTPWLYRLIPQRFARGSNVYLYQPPKNQTNKLNKTVVIPNN